MNYERAWEALRQWLLGKAKRALVNQAAPLLVAPGEVLRKMNQLGQAQHKRKAKK